MMEIVLAADDAAALKTQLLERDVEAAAVLLAGNHRRTDGTERLLVREVVHAEESDYARRGHLEAELAPDFVARVTKRARRYGLSMVFAHSHPGRRAPEFSATDDAGERALAAFLAHRHPKRPHAALLVSAGGWKARRLGINGEARIVSVGSERTVVQDPWTHTSEVAPAFDRQVRAFGPAGQRAA